MATLTTQSPTDLIDLMWHDLTGQLMDMRGAMESVQVRTERSEITGGVRPEVLANVPLAANGASAGDHLWITDGRKIGEGPGAGTGVTAYYDAAGNTWKRVSDDSIVVN